MKVFWFVSCVSLLFLSAIISPCNSIHVLYEAPDIRTRTGWIIFTLKIQHKELVKLNSNKRVESVYLQKPLTTRGRVKKRYWGQRLIFH